MKCFYPKLYSTALFKNIDYLKDKYSLGSFQVSCGNCYACWINHRRDWVARMLLENQSHKRSVFVTLTYSDQNLPSKGHIVKKDLQDFFKRLRYFLGEDKIKYFACGEYGEKRFRPHYHAIIWNVSAD